MPDARSEADLGLAGCCALVQTAERGGFAFALLPDMAGAEDVDAIAGHDRGREAMANVAWLESMQMVPALAMLTSRIGLVATASVNGNDPFHVARRFATIDHISGGRAGWHVETAQRIDEMRNLGDAAALEPVANRERAAEFVAVCAGLWNSWDADAVLRDRESGRYFDPDKVHLLNHRGRFYSVRGPLNVARCPQGRPVIVQSCHAVDDGDLAASCADVVLVHLTSVESTRDLVRDLRARAAGCGRAAADVKVLAHLLPIVGATDREAESRRSLLQSLLADGGGSAADPAALSAERCRIVCGAPGTIADRMQDWLEACALDGFAIEFPYYPAPVTEFVDHVVPELLRRGIFRAGETGTTLREQLGLRHDGIVGGAPAGRSTAPRRL